jgi:cysteine desulfurase
MMSLSAHKCYGPKGVGALWLRGGPATTPVAPLFFGGGQEKGLRAGTANTPAIVGFGEAVRLAAKRLEKDSARIARLRDHLETQIRVRIPAAVVNGAEKNRLPGLTSLTFPGIDADALIARLPEIDLSTASACHTGTPEPSHVLRAIGLTSREAYATLRIALGRTTTREDVEYASRRIGEAVGELRTFPCQFTL